jgi:hypothetical protein
LGSKQKDLSTRFTFGVVFLGDARANDTNRALVALLDPRLPLRPCSCQSAGSIAVLQPCAACTRSTSAAARRQWFVSFFRDAEWYFSRGYNKEFWSNTDIHVSQPGLGNDFTIHDVQGQDELQQLGDIFTTSLFGPQYNFRIGRFINDSFGVELNFDHTKYTTIVGQTANVTGGIGGTPVNGPYQLTNTFFSEVLHNGANHLMINGVYRSPLVGKLNETSSLAFIGKAGAGVMLPHTTDTILGNTNNVGDKTFSNSFGLTNGWWQLNGWTAGAELGFRYVVWKPVYLELTDKVAYSYFGDLPAYQGTLQQSLWMNEIILSVGFTYDGTSK